MSDKDVYSKSCNSQLPVLLHLREKLLQLTEKMKIITPFFEFQRASCLQWAEPLGKEEFPNKIFEENARPAGN